MASGDAVTASSSSYIDLALIRQQSEVDAVDLTTYVAWTGLRRNPAGSDGWLYSDGTTYPYRPWASNEPHSSEDCALALYPTARFAGSYCERLSFFFCHVPKPAQHDFHYHFIPQSKTWLEAQDYCRTHYSDLATIPQNNALSSILIQRDFPVWTGLHRDGGEWKWSTGLSDYRRWGTLQPGSDGDCVSINSTSKLMATRDCSSRLPFSCYSDNLLLVKENKTWEEALRHCRGLEPLVHYNPLHYRNYRYDLVSAQPGDDQLYLLDKMRAAAADEVWAGLRFLAGDWLWVNGVQLSYPDLPSCPAPGQRCAALFKGTTASLEVRNCTEKRHFLCYRR
uniref:C-type mannose receptor 2-like n=1 Tax=Centroberyx gerrardi TaxID=166262 RepID=UPI003AAD38BD